MDGAYFVGRVELLNWLNDLLKLDYTKVEQTCSGAAACQIMDAIYPGSVPLGRVNFNAKQEYEYVQNYKILQTVFAKHTVDRHIDVPKLIKGKYQDNLEFLQWIKKYYELNSSGEGYDAVERRTQAGAKVTGAPKASSKAAAPSKAPAKVATKAAAPSKASTVTPTKAPAKQASASSASAPADNSKLQEAAQQIAELKLTIDGIEKERDFYFEKLRAIEIRCLDRPDQEDPFVKDLLKIMYATEDGDAAAAAGEDAPAEEEEETF
eukprot:TRINITY_DN11637_c0_g1_i1.p1 TRINITY_DN11637_c0_g1~~TRINITY_DN11637_c0_g1_i1.p1  ORF type:complete len:277 (+),score=56.19 TRINITY_DN11637_c0_g1_i1:38-832(+)